MTQAPPERRVVAGRKVLATLVGAPTTESATRGRYVLSRFAFLRRDGDEFVLESPLAATAVRLHDPRALAALDAMREPKSLDELASAIRELKPTAATELVELFRESGVLIVVNESGTPADEQGSMQFWEFHDLLFHSRSRGGRYAKPAGGTYRFAGRVEPVPAYEPRSADVRVELPRPDMDRLEAEDRPLAWTQEARMSQRRYGSDPITDAQLGEFLYRIARVADFWKMDVMTPAGSVVVDFAARPYPSGGALYELEFYVAVNACANLERGLYHYDPVEHRLELVNTDVDALVADGAFSAGIEADSVQVLLILAARYGRIAWKYETLAYSLLLKNVGVVYEAMYLVATSMGLAPCALGRGNSDRFAEVAGTDYYAETSVGEFLLGSRRD